MGGVGDLSPPLATKEIVGSDGPEALKLMVPIGHYRLGCIARDPVRLPAYAGSAWRGLLGHALKRAVCVTRRPECPGCRLRPSCIYTYVFETPPPPESTRMRRYPAAPHPFVLAPPWDAPRRLRPGERFELDFQLIGRANGRLPYILHALARGGETGIGKGNGRYRVERLEQASTSPNGRWTTIYRDGGELNPVPPRAPEVARPPCRARVELRTPLRLYRDGRLLDPDRLRFDDLFRSLLRRISSLCYFHDGHSLEADFAALTRQSRDIDIGERRLRWADWHRYSSRQDASVPMGGLLGTFEIGDGLATFWPYLWVGQWLHAGKGASMGLGRYRLEPASLPVQTAGPDA